MKRRACSRMYQAQGAGAAKTTARGASQATELAGSGGASANAGSIDLVGGAGGGNGGSAIVRER